MFSLHQHCFYGNYAEPFLKPVQHFSFGIQDVDLHQKWCIILFSFIPFSKSFSYFSLFLILPPYYDSGSGIIILPLGYMNYPFSFSFPQHGKYIFSRKSRISSHLGKWDASIMRHHSSGFPYNILIKVVGVSSTEAKVSSVWDIEVHSYSGR